MASYSDTPGHRLSVTKVRFRDIEFGEEDANLDYEVSLGKNTQPSFLRAFLSHPTLQISQLEDATKYIVLGQKGTGKTALLRKLQSDMEKRGAITQFMIFRDEVASKEELDKLGAIFAVSVNDVKKVQHHLYTLERLILLLIASQVTRVQELSQKEEPKEGAIDEENSLGSLVKRVFGQPLRKVVDATLDSVYAVAESVTVDLDKATKGLVHSDPNVLLRNLNEKLTDICIKGLKESTENVVIFIDEIHFTYRNGHDHDQDASLVRDLIRTVAKLNRIFTRELVPCRIFIAIRSEFLNHPLISAAELHQYLNTFGVEISWSTFPANLEHPMFDIGALRVDLNNRVPIKGKDFMRACFANFTSEDAAEFVQSTWSKPRDIIRFLRTCKEMFPDKLTLSQNEYSAVFHKSCITAWKEVEVALTSFLTIKGVEHVRKLLASNSSKSLEKGFVGPVDNFVKLLKPIANRETQVGAMTQPESLFEVLYMLGCVYTTRKTTSGGPIIHSFHRGQNNPDWEANVAIHRGVAKSFS